MAQPGFFDLDERYRRLSETGDPLVKLAELVELASPAFGSRFPACASRERRSGRIDPKADGPDVHRPDVQDPDPANALRAVGRERDERTTCPPLVRPEMICG